MFSYSDDATTAVRCYVGTPDCAAAYDWILAQLQSTTTDWLQNKEEFSDRIKGNIGEFVAFHLTTPGAGGGWYIFYSNVDSPLARNSATGLDISYLFIGADDSGIDDQLVIQEIKTTGSSDLEYARRLIDDHEKLCSTDPGLNLQSRVRALKARMRDIHGCSQDILSRVQKLAHPKPGQCKKVTFLPTLVHERIGATPISMLSKVRSSISTFGWKIELIKPVSIALSKLDNGFCQLACNKKFKPK